jgi:hypothetical protein
VNFFDQKQAICDYHSFDAINNNAYGRLRTKNHSND